MITIFITSTSCASWPWESAERLPWPWNDAQEGNQGPWPLPRRKKPQAPKAKEAKKKSLDSIAAKLLKKLDEQSSEFRCCVATTVHGTL